MKRDSLWKISVNTSPEAEEAVTQLLHEIFGQPATVYVDAQSHATVVSVYLPAKAPPGTRKSAANEVEDDGHDSERFKDQIRQALQRMKTCGLAIGPGAISVEKIRREDWAESWKRHFKPIEIRSALLLKPSWSQRRPKNNQAVVVLDPGLSFGTGQHPTTRFCLEQLVAFRRKVRAQSFLDFGTGSGILAIAAARLGYRPVRAIDDDPDAIRIARANARRNGVLTKVRFGWQDVRRLPLRGSTKYDLICANLTHDLLIGESRRIINRLQPAGALVVAGLLRSEFSKLRACYEQCRLKLLRFKAEKEWASGVFVAQRASARRTTRK